MVEEERGGREEEREEEREAEGEAVGEGEPEREGERELSAADPIDGMLPYSALILPPEVGGGAVGIEVSKRERERERE